MKFEKDEKNPNLTHVTLETEAEREEMRTIASLFCDCPENEIEYDMDNIEYVEYHMGVDHGWICLTCRKFVQMG